MKRLNMYSGPSRKHTTNIRNIPIIKQACEIRLTPRLNPGVIKG